TQLITFEVTPVAATGISLGVPATSTGLIVPTLTAINVTPANASVPQGVTQQFTATGIYNNGSTADITSSVSWSSSKTASATINSAGLASALGNGNPIITAVLTGVSG